MKSEHKIVGINVEEIKYVEGMSEYVRSCKGKMRPGTARVFPCLP